MKDRETWTYALETSQEWAIPCRLWHSQGLSHLGRRALQEVRGKGCGCCVKGPQSLTRVGGVEPLSSSACFLRISNAQLNMAVPLMGRQWSELKCHRHHSSAAKGNATESANIDGAPFLDPTLGHRRRTEPSWANHDGTIFCCPSFPLVTLTLCLGSKKDRWPMLVQGKQDEVTSGNLISFSSNPFPPSAWWSWKSTCMSGADRTYFHNWRDHGQP